MLRLPKVNTFLLLPMTVLSGIIYAMKKIYLANNKGTVFIDDEDFNYLSTLKWHAQHTWNNRLYAVTSLGGKKVQMHRIVLGTPAGKFTDHINGNGLDNRRANLRLATISQNKANSGPYRNNKNGYRGVTWASKNRWRAKINVNNRRIDLGCFKTREEAARAYDQASDKWFGGYGYKNNPV